MTDGHFWFVHRYKNISGQLSAPKNLPIFELKTQENDQRDRFEAVSRYTPLSGIIRPPLLKP
jgi:hypothetical protein